MLFHFNQYSALLLIFFVHGLVYAFLLYRKGAMQESMPEKWLSLFLFLCILYITPWMTGFAGWYDTQPYRDILFYVPFQQLYLIGPVIFFYLQSLLNPAFHFGRKEWLHFLPGLLYVVFSGVMVIADKLLWKNYVFLANGRDPDFDTWYQLTGFTSMLIYFFLSLRYYHLYRKMIVQVISYAGTVLFRWVQNFLLAFFIMLCVRVIFFVLAELTSLNYADNWWYFLAFAILFYYIAISGFANTVETKIAFRPNLLRHRPVILLGYDPSGAGPAGQHTEEADVLEITNESTAPDITLLQPWKEKLLLLMEGSRLYEDPELSLTQLAQRAEANPSFISMVVNRGFGLNFNDFINQFRVKAVQEKLEKGDHKKQTLLGIAYDCGFNSKATFNRAFKKVTGQNPKDFISTITSS